MTNDTVHFNVYCTTMKQQQSTRYSNTVLYNTNSTVNASITGLLPNTTYTCCVLAVTSYGESEPVCQNITTTNVICKCTVYNYVIYVAQNKIIRLVNVIILFLKSSMSLIIIMTTVTNCYNNSVC